MMIGGLASMGAAKAYSLPTMSSLIHVNDGAEQ